MFLHRRFGLVSSGLLCLILVMGAASQERKITRQEVPAPVLAAFEKAYPKARIVGFSEEEENGKLVYEVESKEGTVTRDVLYNADGTVIVVEERIAPADLPAAVRQAIQKEAPKGAIVRSEKLMRGQETEYEVVVKEGAKKTEILLNPAGKVLRREGK